MVSPENNIEYIKRATETEQKYGFWPIKPDLEGRGRDRLKRENNQSFSIAEIYQSLDRRQFDLPNYKDQPVIFAFGSPSETEGKINPRLPFGEIVVSRDEASGNPEVVLEFKLFVFDSSDREALESSLVDRVAFLNDQVDEREVQLTGSTKTINDGVERFGEVAQPLPIGWTQKLANTQDILFHQIGYRTRIRIGERTSDLEKEVAQGNFYTIGLYPVSGKDKA